MHLLLNYFTKQLLYYSTLPYLDGWYTNLTHILYGNDRGENTHKNHSHLNPLAVKGGQSDPQRDPAKSNNETTKWLNIESYMGDYFWYSTANWLGRQRVKRRRCIKSWKLNSTNFKSIYIDYGSPCKNNFSLIILRLFRWVVHIY